MAINEAGIEVVLVLVHTRPFSSLIKLNKQVVHEAGIEAGIEVVLVRVRVHARPFSSLIKLNKQVVHDPGCNLQHHKYRVNFLYTFINALYIYFFLMRKLPLNWQKLHQKLQRTTTRLWQQQQLQLVKEKVKGSICYNTKVYKINWLK